MNPCQDILFHIVKEVTPSELHLFVLLSHLLITIINPIVVWNTMVILPYMLGQYSFSEQPIYYVW